MMDLKTEEMNKVDVEELIKIIGSLYVENLVLKMNISKLMEKNNESKSK